MKWLKNKILSSLGIGLAVPFGIAAWLFLRSSDPVTVSVINASRQAISSVRVSHEHGIEQFTDLSPGASKIVRIKAVGETTYRLEVQFAGGQVITGGGGYAESGYTFTEMIGDSSINTLGNLPDY